MSISKLLARASAVALFASFLTACGGGGGGGGGDGSPGGAGGSDNLAVVDRTNARQFAAGYRDVLNVATEAVYYSPYLINDLVGIARSSAEESFDCSSSGSVKLSSSVDSAGIGTLTLQYNNCTEQDFYYGYQYRYSGTIRITTRAFNGYPTAFDYHYDNYKFENLQAGMSNSYSGDFSVDSDAGGIRFAASLTTTNSRTQSTTKTINYVAIFNGDEMPTQASGRIELSSLGSVTVAGDSAHTYLSGRQGILRLDSDPLSGNYTVHLALDQNSDNTTDSFAWIPWYALDYQAETNTAPTVAVSHPGLQLQANQNVTIPINGVSDTEYDLLSYSIQTVQSPGNIDLQLALQEDQSFTFRTGANGDYIIALTVDDGRGGVTTQHITFHVSLPAPIVLSPGSVNVNAGALATASVQPSNLEAGPFTYQLLSGPAGMSVDNQGNLQWQATSAFFDRVEVQGSVKVSNSDHELIVPVNFTIAGGSSVPIVQTGTNWGPSRDKNVYILDFNNDGSSRTLVTDNKKLIHTLKYQAGSYVEDWVFPYSVADEGEIDHIVPFDTDNDGNYEIAAQVDGRILVINEAHDIVDRSLDLHMEVGLGLAAADIDNDGTIELIALMSPDGSSYNQVAVILDAATLTEEWRTPAMALGTDVAVGNVDGDSALELVFAGGYVYDGATHGNEWAHSSEFGNRVYTGDIDGDSIDEIVSVWASQYGSYPTAYSAVSKSQLWSITDETTTCALGLVQLDGDSAREIVATNCWGMSGVRAYDATSSAATLKWNVPAVLNASAFAAGDIDNNGGQELVPFIGGAYGTRSYPTVVNAATQAVLFNGLGDAAGDFTGAVFSTQNGSRQVLFSSMRSTGVQNGFSLLALDPATQAIDVSPVIASTGGYSPPICAADYDGDGTDDVLFGTNENYSTNFVASYDLLSQSEQWRRTTSSGYSSQHLLACADFNSDGHTDVASYSGSSYTLSIDDAFNQMLLWSGGPSLSLSQLLAGDTDGDGKPELFTVSTPELRKFSPTGGGYSNDGTFSMPYDPFLATKPIVSLVDVDGDLRPEIVVAAANSDWILGQPTTTTLIVVNSNLTERSRATYPGIITALAPERIGNGQVLAAVAENAASYSSQPAKHRVAVVDLSSGQWVWRSPLLLGPVMPDSLHYDASMPGDGSISIGTSAAMYITR